MNIKLITLTLQCRKSKEVINFSPQLSFFHGQISVGKSSILRLIDFCLGGELERTPAITQEMVSAGLSCCIGDYEVLFEREAQSSNLIQVSWKNVEGEIGSVLAPIKSVPKSIWGDSVYNLSDLIFYFLNITPIKVRRSRIKEDSPLVRLSFRDILWYCYLKQELLVSSFFQLEHPFKGPKSQDVMRFLVGYYTEKLNDLEIHLEELKEKRAAKVEAVNQIRLFLKEFDYDTERAIITQIEQLNIDLNKSISEQGEIRKRHMEDTHFADELRNELRKLNTVLTTEEQVLSDLREKIEEQKTLRAEILTMKFKLAKETKATLFLSGVEFELCPLCGMKMVPLGEKGTCPLCKSVKTGVEESKFDQAELVRKDLTTRLDDITESIERHERALKKQERRVKQIKGEKAILDGRLCEELKNYDSAFLSRSREVDRQVATIRERIKGLEKIAQMVKSIERLDEEAINIKSEIDRTKWERDEEKKTLTNAIEYVHEIERTYLNFLLTVGVPGVTEADKVEIDIKTWKPSILPKGEKGLVYDFYNAGSSGKKALLNICYALALHTVATKNKLPLPDLLIIDSPMQHIGKDVDRDIFISFYNLVYELASGILKNTQFILVEREYIKPENFKDLDIYERFMTTDQDEKPPLISYYRGP